MSEAKLTKETLKEKDAKDPMAWGLYAVKNKKSFGCATDIGHYPKAKVTVNKAYQQSYKVNQNVQPTSRTTRETAFVVPMTKWKA